MEWEVGSSNPHFHAQQRQEKLPNKDTNFTFKSSVLSQAHLNNSCSSQQHNILHFGTTPQKNFFITNATIKSLIQSNSSLCIVGSLILRISQKKLEPRSADNIIQWIKGYTFCIIILNLNCN